MLPKDFSETRILRMNNFECNVFGKKKFEAPKLEDEFFLRYVLTPPFMELFNLSFGLFQIIEWNLSPVLVF